MKYSYFSTNRGGRLHHVFLSLANNKSVARFKQKSCGLFYMIWNPNKEIREWYWEDKNNNIRHVSEHRRYDNIDWISAMDDFQLNEKENDNCDNWISRNYCYTTPYYLDNNITPHPNNLYNSFEHVFECDHITIPEPLLGYHGYSKPDREGTSLNDALEKDIRHLNVDLNYSVEQFKRRKNIIAYKENIKMWARDWFLGGAFFDNNCELYYQTISCRINHARQYHKSIQIALDRFDIPYELWSLDSGCYSKFGLTNNIYERYQSKNIDTLLPKNHHNKIDEWVDRYMSEYP